MNGPRTHENSVTYLIQGEHGGPIKIGLSNHTGLSQRIASLQTGYPYRLRILQTIDGNHEARLHLRFAHHRLNGEWFSPGADLLGFCGSEAKLGEYADYRSGYEDGYHRALLEVKLSLHTTFERLELPRSIELAAEQAVQRRRNDP